MLSHNFSALLSMFLVPTPRLVAGKRRVTLAKAESDVESSSRRISEAWASSHRVELDVVVVVVSLVVVFVVVVVVFDASDFVVFVVVVLAVVSGVTNVKRR